MFQLIVDTYGVPGY
jgi:V-type H+-transporting ATPase subunit a